MKWICQRKTDDCPQACKFASPFGKGGLYERPPGEIPFDTSCPKDGTPHQCIPYEERSCETCKYPFASCFEIAGRCSALNKWEPKEHPMPEYEIIKDVSCKSVYAATLTTEWFEKFIHYFLHVLSYRFDGPISLSVLKNWFKEHPSDRNFFIEQGFLREKRPAFKPFDLRIETEEEVKMFQHLVKIRVGESLQTYCEKNSLNIQRQMIDPMMDLWQRLNAIYSPTRIDGEGG